MCSFDIDIDIDWSFLSIVLLQWISNRSCKIYAREWHLPYRGPDWLHSKGSLIGAGISPLRALHASGHQRTKLLAHRSCTSQASRLWLVTDW